MKKNKMMRIASALLVLTLITTCAISATFAKYVSSDSVTDNARVAYWGFGADVMTDLDLFDGNYTNVLSNDSTNVVAPGTTKSSTINLSYDVNGETKAPEVAYKYDVVAVATTTNGYATLDANQNFTWIFTAPNGDVRTFQTVKELVDAINATSQAKIEAGNLPTGYAEDGTAAFAIAWNWAFEDADDDQTDADEMADQDAIDTAMGNDTTPDDVTITITITATQID